MHNEETTTHDNVERPLLLHFGAYPQELAFQSLIVCVGLTNICEVLGYVMGGGIVNRYP